MSFHHIFKHMLATIQLTVLKLGDFSLFIPHEPKSFLFNLHFHDWVIWDYQGESAHHYPGIRITFAPQKHKESDHLNSL